MVLALIGLQFLGLLWIIPLFPPWKSSLPVLCISLNAINSNEMENVC